MCRCTDRVVDYGLCFVHPKATVRGVVLAALKVRSSPNRTDGFRTGTLPFPGSTRYRAPDGTVVRCSPSVTPALPLLPWVSPYRPLRPGPNANVLRYERGVGVLTELVFTGDDTGRPAAPLLPEVWSGRPVAPRVLYSRHPDLGSGIVREESTSTSATPTRW